MIFKNFEERYAPKTIDDVVFASEQSRQLVRDLITGLRTFPVKEGKCGILLHGKSGTGKSALAKILPEAMEKARTGGNAYEHYKRITAGENGLKMLTDVNRAAQLIPAASYHYFVLDEVDQLSVDAMKILKSTMNMPSTVFVLTTNFYNKIDPAVRDRCYCIPFNAAPDDKWLPFVHRVLKDAKVEGIPDSVLLGVISGTEGSARNVIADVQNLVIETYRANGLLQS